MIRQSRWILGIALISMLVACGSKSSGNASVSDATPYDNGVSSSGLGMQSRFGDGGDYGERYSTNAPSNQVYLFAFDNSTVDEKYLPAIDAQANYLHSHPNAKVMLAGHTDQVGSREYNIALGERRAKSVYQLMLLKGAGRNQVRVVSYGKERPVALEDTAAAHSKNRRVELIYEVVR